MSRPDTYTFGDTPTAADRLNQLAKVFQPAAVEVLRRWAPPAPGQAVDLGSGPGHTTRMVHEVTGARRTTGVERSGTYLAAARTRGGDGIDYVEHDVTDAPIPVPPADLVYVRFLLTHLADPRAALAGWLTLLAPGGRLIVQETAWLRSPHPELGRYYELVADLQRHYGQALEIGSSLAGLGAGLGAQVLHAQVRQLSPDAAAMARLHELNLRTWRHDPYMQEHVEATELDRVATELDRVAAGLDRVARGEETGAVVDQGMGELVLQVP